MYFVTKTYGHELGLSATFRQWRADSHCRFLHGYPLSFKFTFGAHQLDKNGWVMDFGGLKPLKAHLVGKYDHKLLIAADDPQRERLLALGLNTKNEGYGCSAIDCPPVANPLVIPGVGCEAFAKQEFDTAAFMLQDLVGERLVHIVEVEVREHAGNSAIYRNPMA